MALIKCAECGGTVSDQASACPHCGAPKAAPAPQPKPTASPVPIAAVFLLIVVIAILVSAVRGGADGTEKSQSGAAQAQATPSPKVRVVNFDEPLETSGRTLVCPLSALFEVREGRGVQAAMKSRMSVFSRQEEAEKAGCEEWQEGVAVVLADAQRTMAKKWQTAGSCGMVASGDHLFFTCELRNTSAGPASPAPATPAEIHPAESPPPVAELPPPIKMKPGSPATLEGAYGFDAFDQCCVDGKETRQRFAFVRLDRSIYLHELGPDARAKNENLVGAVQLGVSPVSIDTIAPGQRISVKCSSLDEGETGHYALPAYCREPEIVLQE